MLTFERVIATQGTFRLSVDMQLAAGRVTAIIGPSGGGKSTLLAAVAGFIPVQGRVLWGGTPLAASPAQRPVAVMFQDNNLFPHLTVAQNVGLGLRPSLGAASQVNDALTAVGLGGMGARKPAELSGGQQSRAGLARVLVSERPIVLLDEPFAALGPGLKADMLDLVRARLARRTVLMVTHDPDDARRIADDACLVADGAATPPQPVAEFMNNPSDTLRQYLTSAE